MAETLVKVTVVLIGAAHATVRDLDNDFGWCKVSVALGLDNLATCRALEDSEIDTHCGRSFRQNTMKFEVYEELEENEVALA